ncbi:tetratricopeptide (TPR) repeat protein [Epilithonimonas hungarica]|uniref:tetratricopeptide repeat protein n=1 Tax=Epilithonimonas hungarica TaxID=454006 RepID=UPI00277DD5AD|nr:tetratricopeptide repeat protein [Epilithonimonas hungarica]MDP9957783.1 tetratricopeptide (TPR) repeat protein [Epilithonimonas hungarica]
MNVSKKIVLTAAIGFFANLSFGQSVQDGINYVDSQKYAKAKQNFTDLINKDPKDASNYFYLGNTYLTQFDPNFNEAQDSFNKGLAADSKSYLNKIGLASIKLGKGDKSAIAEIQQIVKDSKEKDAEVLFRAGEALTLFEKNSSPDLAITFLNKAVEKAQKNGVPANYYYSLGDAYRLKKDPGNAMSAYDKAVAVAKSKASVYTRMGTLWMAAQRWQQAKENIDKAIAVDPTYAPAYKALAGFNIKYQKNAEATQNLINYTKYADDDPYTKLEIAKLYFTNEDLANAKTTLDSVFDKVDDPIKYRLRAYIQYGDGDYTGAQQNIETFLSKAEKSRIQPSDEGLQGLIAAGMAKDEKDAAKKAQLDALAQQKIAIAKAAKDETLKWDEELAKVKGGINSASVDQGPTSPEIEALKKKIVENPSDTDSLYKLATEYQNVQNWNGAILTWGKMISALPDWAPAYYSQGYAYQQAKNNDMAKASYEKFISLVKPAEIEASKPSLGYAYFFIAFMEKDTDPEKAKQDIAKSLEYEPTYQDAINLQKALNK